MDNNPNPHKSFLKSILFLVLAAIVLIIISGLTGYFLAKKQTNVQLINQLTPTSSVFPILTQILPMDETANWKTYTATGIYEIQYPLAYYSIKSGSINQMTEWPGVISIYPNDSLNDKKPLAATYSIDISIFNNSNNLSSNEPEKLFGGNNVQFSPSPEEIKRIKEITLGGIKFYRLDDLPYGQSGIKADMVTIKNNKIYEIQVMPVQVSGNLETNIKFFNQILSTFKFLDSSEEKVLGIQPTVCCFCPTKVSSSLIGQDGWMLYEQGKDYSNFEPKTCKNIQCAPCPPLN